MVLQKSRTQIIYCAGALEACAYQTRDIVESMERDTGIELLKLKVDGGIQ